jgi:DNA polymerase-3 subunit delta'
VASTYLFHGPEGVGAWATALSLAALLNCESIAPGNDPDRIVQPCGECTHCRNIYALNFEGLYFAIPLPPHKNRDQAIDLTNEAIEHKRTEPFKMLTSKSSTTIPIVIAREIKTNLSRRAGDGIKRVVLFYQMEKMRTASADALLKLIEEPPSDTVIILTARRPEALLPTLQSRSAKVKLDRVHEDTAAAYLTDRYSIAPDRARLLIRLSDGSLGRAIELIGAGDEADASNRAVGLLLFKSLFEDKSVDTVAHINELVNLRDRGEAVEMLVLWQSLLRDTAACRALGEEAKLVNLDFAGELKRLSSGLAGSRELAQMVEEIKITLADLRLNVHIQGALTSLALRLKREARVAG